MPSGRTNNFPWKWAWPRSRDPTIFGIRSNISPKLLQLDTSNLVGGFVLGMPSRRRNNFPESGRGIGHATLQFLAVRSAILATAWLLVNHVIVQREQSMLIATTRHPSICQSCSGQNSSTYCHDSFTPRSHSKQCASIVATWSSLTLSANCPCSFLPTGV